MIELKDPVPDTYKVNGVEYEFKPIKLNFDTDSWLEAPYSQSGSRTRATVAGWGYDKQVLFLSLLSFLYFISYFSHFQIGVCVVGP